MRIQVFPTRFRCLFVKDLILNEPVEDSIELYLILNGESPFEVDQIDGFLETIELGAEHHRAAEGDGLLDVVDVDPEPATDIHKTGILVELRKNPDGVDQINLVGRDLLERLANLFEVFFGNVVRSDDHAVIVGSLINLGDEQLLIRGPCAACNDAFPAINKIFNFGETLGGPGNSGHPVKTGVAA